MQERALDRTWQSPADKPDEVPGILLPNAHKLDIRSAISSQCMGPITVEVTSELLSP